MFGHRANKQTADSEIASMEAIMTLASFCEPRNDYQFKNTAFDLRDSVAVALPGRCTYIYEETRCI